VKAALVVLCLAACAAGVAQTPAEALIEAGHWKRARALVDARFRANPHDALACFLESQIHAAFGDREAPLRLAEQAVALDGSVAKYHRQVAEAVGIAAEHSGALQQLFLARRFKKEIDAALAMDPSDVQALRDLMEFYLVAPGIAGGDNAKARATAVRIAGVNRAQGYSAEARLAQAQGDRSRAEALLRQAADAEPRTYKLRMALAEFYLAPEHPSFAAAEREAGEALKIDPGRAAAYAALASCYAAGQRWSDLDAVLASAAREVPDDLSPRYRAAETLVEEDRAPDRAAAYLRAYLAAEPEGDEPTLAEAHWKLGQAFAKLGRASEAAGEWREALRLDPQSPAAHDLKRAGV